jgi:hypothetical protein
VALAFDEALAEPPEIRAQAVFRAIFSGLQISLSHYKQIADWLGGTTP